MQIEIDFEVFKALTARRESESDSYNAVIRRLLSLSSQPNALAAFAEGKALGAVNALAEGRPASRKGGLFGADPKRNALAEGNPNTKTIAQFLGGVWYGNVHFPEGTKFRATYKGQTYFAEISNGQWTGADGMIRNSPSDAASAISKTNVNGWRFWYVQLPGDPSWRRLDELKS